MFREKINIVLVFVTLLFLVVMAARCYEGRKLKAEIAEQQTIMKLNQYEIDRLNEELNARCANDCVLERTWYGFTCREFKADENGKRKIFRVFM